MMYVIASVGRASNCIDRMALKTVTSDHHDKRVVDVLHRMAVKTFIINT